LSATLPTLRRHARERVHFARRSPPLGSAGSAAREADIQLIRFVLSGLAVGLATGLAEAAEPPPRISLVYDMHLGGLHMAQLEFAAEMEGDTYALRSETQTRGLFNALVGFVARVQTRGMLTENGPRPAHHRAANQWRGGDRWAEIHYGPDGRVDAAIHPPPEEDDRPKVPVEMRADTVDPLTAALAMWRGVDSPQACEGEVRVFDGRRRYDLAFAPGGPGTWKNGPLRVPASLCTVRIHRLAGFSGSPWIPASRDVDEATVWLASADERLPPLPVRMESESAVGMAVIRLVSIDGKPLPEP